MITQLQPNEIFVFGSNLAGNHAGGAAAQAHKEFGAEMGVGEGLTGRSYAFPTLDEEFGRISLERLVGSRDRLYAACMSRPESRFLLTKVGCGIAGYPEAEMKSLFANPPSNLILPEDWSVVERVLVLRTCAADMRSYNGFKWPEAGRVSCPDWSPRAECGNGLHGWLWGRGDGSLGNWNVDAKWLVVSVDKSKIVDLEGKVKFPAGEVVFCGDRSGAVDYLVSHGAPNEGVIAGTATAGDAGTATAGVRGTATAGDAGTATAGDEGTATAGVRGTATAHGGSDNLSQSYVAERPHFFRIEEREFGPRKPKPGEWILKAWSARR